jgi:hypothetical protein
MLPQDAQNAHDAPQHPKERGRFRKVTRGVCQVFPCRGTPGRYRTTRQRAHEKPQEGGNPPPEASNPVWIALAGL